MEAMEQFLIEEEVEMGGIAEAVLLKAQKDTKNILLLNGELGAGKTTFTKHLAKILNIEEEIQSPTFILQKKYSIKNSATNNSAFEQLIHIDAYRFDHPQEAEILEIEKLAENPKNLVVIEWPEKIGEEIISKIKPQALEIFFEHINTNENTRKIKF